MFTRFHDDPARIRKQSEVASYTGRYFLSTPGQGVDLPFHDDPHVRMQSWGANFCLNAVSLENDLRGMTRKLNRDDVQQNEYLAHKVERKTLQFPSAQPFVQESRASHPAWMYRSTTLDRWEAPWQNPQANLEKAFPTNVNSRIRDSNSRHTENSLQDLLPTFAQ